jgi:solute carrier family 35 protein E1
MVAPLSFCWTLGFVLFNASASQMSPSHVNLVRCAEPFATVAVGFLFLSKRYSPQLLLTLIPICGGVALASWNIGNNDGSGKTSSLSLPGIILAALSNVSFCVRPFCLQRLKQHQQPQQPFDDDVLVFFYVTLMASVGLPLFVMTIEGAAIGDAIRRLATDNADDGRLLFSQFLTNAFGSSIFFVLYQFTQLQVMSTMSPLAFSILTPVVKAIMIVVCSLYFGDSLGIFSFLGILSTTGGGYLFSRILLIRSSRNNSTTTTTSRIITTTTTTKDKNLPLYHNGGTTTTSFKTVCKPHQV